MHKISYKHMNSINMYTVYPKIDYIGEQALWEYC